MNPTPEITILNPQIELRRDQNGKTYFLIHNPTTSIAYFAFPGQVKKGWHALATKWTQAQEIHIQFGNDPKKILALKILTRKDIRERKRRERERDKP